jgi:hypothetical protein
MIIVDNLKSFYEFFKYLDLEVWEVSGNFVIVFTEVDEEIYENMEKIFQAFWSKYIVNVVIMYASHANITEVMVYTYFPYTPKHCENTTPILLNQYSRDKFLMDVPYFPQKLDNFHRCKIFLVTFINPPFMFFNKIGDKYTVDGIEGKILVTLQSKLNMRLKMFVDPGNHGRTFKNGTVTGNKKNIFF